MMPPGPPTVTGMSADFTGRAAIKPSKAESARRLENIATVVDRKRKNSTAGVSRKEGEG
jgi:hypothetical protein